MSITKLNKFVSELNWTILTISEFNRKEIKEIYFKQNIQHLEIN